MGGWRTGVVVTATSITLYHDMEPNIYSDESFCLHLQPQNKGKTFWKNIKVSFFQDVIDYIANGVKKKVELCFERSIFSFQKWN